MQLELFHHVFHLNLLLILNFLLLQSHHQSFSNNVNIGPLLLVRFTWCRTFTGIFLKISFLCFFARLLHLFLIFLRAKYFFLESYFKYLFILDLLNSLFRKDAWLPLIVFGFVDACSQKTYEKISVSLAYQSSVL